MDTEELNHYPGDDELYKFIDRETKPPHEPTLQPREKDQRQQTDYRQQKENQLEP